MYYTRILNFLLILIICSCSIIPKKRCWKTGFIKHDSTWFPAPKLDFEPREFQARLGLPNEGGHRVWVKGSERLNHVQAFSPAGEALTDVIDLEEPYFTNILLINNVSTAVIKFGKTAESLKSDTSFVTFNFREMVSMKENAEPFSFLAYGCIQPFYVNEEGNPFLLHDKQNPLNLQMRRLFQKVGLEEALQYLQNDTLIRSKLVQNPVLAIGTGDQIYVDAGYEQTDFREHALSAWAHGCKDPYPLLGHQEYEAHLHRCYQNFYSFHAFQKVFAQIPLISVWDDHEIRDGWGSHGDEYNDKTGDMDEVLAPYFNMAKEAYIYHQLVPGGDVDVDKLLESNAPLYRSYEIKGVPIFAFDLRSNRDIHKNQVINQEQMNAFKQWCSSLNDSSEVLIISSMSFFYKPFVPFKLLGRIFTPGLRDDINDGWYSKYNEGQRNEIIQQLINLRNRNVKPIIISGDAHLGGLISAWYQNDDGMQKRLCYELIYSGLTHEVMGEERNGIIARIRKRSEGNIKDDPTFAVGENNVHYIYEFTQARLNFGAIEFNSGKPTKASLFIVGDEEQYIEKRILDLNWAQTYDEYIENAQSENGEFAPPQLKAIKIPRESL